MMLGLIGLGCGEKSGKESNLNPRFLAPGTWWCQILQVTSWCSSRIAPPFLSLLQQLPQDPQVTPTLPAMAAPTLKPDDTETSHPVK